MFRISRRPVIAIAIAASTAITGASGCVIHVDGDSGGGGSAGTSDTGGSGGGTLSTGGSTFGGAGGGTGGAAVTCSPAPAIETQIDVPIPDGVTADFAAPGRIARLATAPDGDGAVVSLTDQSLFAKRYHGGQWSALEQIALAQTGSLVVAAESLAVASGGAGRVLVVYGEWHSPSVAVCARRFEPGTGWSEPELVGVTTEGWWQDPSAPPVAAGMSASGETMVIWPRSPDSDVGLSARRGAPGAAFGDVEMVSETTSVAGRPALVIHDDGRAVVAWQDNLETQARVYDPASGWGEVQKLDDFGWDMRLAIGDDGSTVALWGAAVGPDGGAVKTATLPAGGVFEPETELSPASGTDLALATAGDGTGIAAWHSYEQMCTYHGVAELRDATGAFSATGPIAGLDDGPSHIASAAAAASGTVVLGWEHQDPDMCGYSAASLSARDPAAGTWQKAELDPLGDTPRVALTPEGQALVVWTRWAEGTTLVRRMDLPAP